MADGISDGDNIAFIPYRVYPENGPQIAVFADLKNQVILEVEIWPADWEPPVLAKALHQGMGLEQANAILQSEEWQATFDWTWTLNNPMMNPIMRGLGFVPKDT